MNMMYLKMLVFLALAFQSNNLPNKALVPDEATAIKIAEAVWLPLYGDRIYKSLPFKAELKSDSIWIVKGTFTKDTSNKNKKLIVIKSGGVPYIEIKKLDCKVLNVSHGK